MPIRAMYIAFFNIKYMCEMSYYYKKIKNPNIYHIFRLLME